MLFFTSNTTAQFSLIQNIVHFLPVFLNLLVEKTSLRFQSIVKHYIWCSFLLTNNNTSTQDISFLVSYKVLINSYLKFEMPKYSSSSFNDFMRYFKIMSPFMAPSNSTYVLKIQFERFSIFYDRTYYSRTIECTISHSWHTLNIFQWPIMYFTCCLVCDREFENLTQSSNTDSIFVQFLN